MATERESVAKLMNEMKKQTSFLDNTRWMFENNPQLHKHNYSPNSI